MRIHSQVLLLFSVFVSFAHVSVCQSTFAPLNDDYYHLIERYELRHQKLSSKFHSGIKPFERKAVVEFLEEIEAEPRLEFNERDDANFRFLKWDSWEWTRDTANLVKGTFRRISEKTGRQRRLWAHPADLYSHRSKDFDIHVNFVTNNFIGKDGNLGKAVMFSGRGMELRGMINEKLGFYTYVSDNQGFFPRYVQDYTDHLNFPGEGLTKIGARKKNADFFSARGYITFHPLKSINLQFGHDKNFFGNGYRSLFLSDNSAPYLFLKLNTRIGRFNYTNLWTSMINNQDAPYPNLLRKKKYTAMHHLSVNITDRLNIGFFEAEVFARDSTGGGFDANYLNPIIFYRFVESYLGSSDNALLGLDFKWLALKNTSLYGQAMIDEFLSRDLFNGRKSWTRKYAFQLGAKRVDAFNIPNFDLQTEYNVVYPYTYSHRDGDRNYMHYKQPLAHPLEANFREFLGIARWQMNERLTLYGTMMLAKKGMDTAGLNYGGDLTLDYDTRVYDSGVHVAQGMVRRTRLFDLRFSYLLKQNLFLDYRMMKRKVAGFKTGAVPNTDLFSVGIRYNMPYRQQTF
ncbi:hypothetical protein GCM10023091_11430 [Ravibacter arvi]|uniref:Capsule assembly protein Wzi n=1 Tax=Ravibacter arvi TaxID=2051041 RepID=A0ABP8LRY8_9BACT